MPTIDDLNERVTWLILDAERTPATDPTLQNKWAAVCAVELTIALASQDAVGRHAGQSGATAAAIKAGLPWLANDLSRRFHMVK